MDHKSYEIFNGIPGLFAIAVTIIFVTIIILIFIVRIFQFPHLRRQIFVADNTLSAHTRIFKIIVFLLLTAGLIGVIVYNIYKMIHDPPKFSLTVELNKSPPSILICSIHNGPTLVTAKYYTNFNNYINKAELPDDLVGDFSDLIGNNGKCRFFNGTSSSSSKLRGNAGGFYVLGFGQDENASGISDIVGDSDRGAFVFIGDTNNEMDWTQPMPQGNKFSNIGFLFFNGVGGLFQYAETHHKALNGSSYRNFQLSSVGTFGFIDYSRPAAAYDVGIIAPENIVAQVENPSLTLADLLTNIGGYLGIWEFSGFSLVEKKVDPFGFVSRFIFIKQDRKKLFEELEKINGERSTKLNISKEEEKDSDSVTKTSNLSNQTEFKNLLAKYYVETDFYEHAVETPDV